MKKSSILSLKLLRTNLKLNQIRNSFQFSSFDIINNSFQTKSNFKSSIKIQSLLNQQYNRSFSSSSNDIKSSLIPKSTKFHSTCESALSASGLSDGKTLLVGGFGLCGIPQTLIESIKKLQTKNLTVVSNNCGIDDYGLGILLQSKQINKMISSYVGENKEFERQYLNGELSVELTPQGTLAEKIRAGGAGIPAFYVKTAVDTIIHKGGFTIKYDKLNKGKSEIISKSKDSRIFKKKLKSGKFINSEYILEESIQGDISLIKAYKVDLFGNCIFRGTAKNFNLDIGKSSQYCIVEAEIIVRIGEIKAEDVHLSGVYIHAIVQSTAEKRIERRTISSGDGKLSSPLSKNKKQITKSEDDIKAEEQRQRIVKRASLELKDGMNVNLGIGMPTLASNYLPKGIQIMLQSENGLLGMGPYPTDDKVDSDYINAGKETITILPGASIFSSSESFAMIRGGHIDIAILGALQVSQTGDLANWIVPGKIVKGMGGACDLVSAGNRVVVTMEHLTKNGKSKLLKSCNLPLTGKKCVDTIITELAVFDVKDKLNDNAHLELIEIADGITIDHLKSVTEAEFKISPNLIKMRSINSDNS